jgi:hypothetical protein
LTRRCRVADAFYTARARVEKVSGVHRLATLGDGTKFDIGVHGIIKEHYRIEAEDLPLPVDYLVAAAGG